MNGLFTEVNGSLKNQPQFDGTTSFCNKSFSLVNQKGPRNLEALLKTLDKSGPMLGTKFGKGKNSKKHRRRRSRNSFGLYPFLEGKLSTSVQTEGLPLGAKSPSSIYQTFPNIFRQGSPLPRPYGPRDNLRMQLPFEVHGFGYRRRSKSKRCKTCGRRRKSRSRKRSKRRYFGTTPGTPEWKHEASMRNIVSTYMNRYANAGQLAEAKGWTPPSALYIGNKASKIPNVIGMPNEPAQFSNNQLNSPILSFGIRRRGSIKRRTGRPSLTKAKKKSTRRRKFGPLIPTVAGPNTVGYQDSIPLYHAGANTIDFATNRLFRPDIVGSIGKVQADGLTPRAWLTQSSGIGDGLGNKYRFGKKSFGGSVITLNSAGKIQITRPAN